MKTKLALIVLCCSFAATRAQQRTARLDNIFQSVAAKQMLNGRMAGTVLKNIPDLPTHCIYSPALIFVKGNGTKRGKRT